MIEFCCSLYYNCMYFDFSTLEDPLLKWPLKKPSTNLQSKVRNYPFGGVSLKVNKKPSQLLVPCWPSHKYQDYQGHYLPRQRNFVTISSIWVRVQLQPQRLQQQLPPLQFRISSQLLRYPFRVRVRSTTRLKTHPGWEPLKDKFNNENSS